MSIEELRTQIDSIDRQLVTLLNQRFDVVKAVGQWKRENNIPILNAKREEEVIRKVTSELPEDRKEAFSLIYHAIMDAAKLYEKD